jgi:hypothetical protein
MVLYICNLMDDARINNGHIKHREFMIK